jgi:hypothetical protein
MLSLGVAVSASAQPKLGGAVRQQATIRGGGGGYSHPKSNVIVVAPSYSINPYYGRPGFGRFYGSAFGFGYSPFYDPFYQYPRVQERPSPLDLAIEDIMEEYDYKIDSTKHDKSLSKDDRKQKVRDLKHEKENAIIDAKKSYYQQKDQKNQKDNDQE